LWFTDPLSTKVGKITTAGVATTFPVAAGGTPVGIAAGPDGNLWFTDNGGGTVSRITPTGTVTPFTIPTSGSGPLTITRGPDNAMWFTENSAGKIGRISVPSGATPTLTISKSAPASVISGQTLTYTLTYRNSGSGGASGVVIQDAIPAGTTFVSASGGGNAAGGVVTWTLGTVNAGGTGTVSFTVTVTATSGSVNNSNYSIQASGIPAVAGSPIATAVTVSGGGGLPNLTPIVPSGWSDRIVVAKTPGTTTDSPTLASTDTLYVNWAVGNNGTAATSVRFFVELYVDGILRSNWYSDPPLLAPDANFSYYVFVKDFSIGALPAGTHTLRIKGDSTGVISESNESDNEYTKTITVAGASAPCVASATTVCLNGGRFAVNITWQSATGSGVGTMVPMTSDTAAVWFFSASNLEMMFKIVNGCAFNNSYWVFAGGLTNVKVTMRVTDTVTGGVKVYDNPLNLAFQPIQDTAAFRCP
ncbi:MAG: CARDB domain-containing protein, partial [Thermoanaerobaculia bacterium]